jgi:signal transduction histidine kinase
MTTPSREALLGLNRAVTTAKLQAGAVHEVNNALQVISGTVEILEGRTDLSPMVVQALERLRNQSRRAAAAMAEVQTFTKAARDTRGPVNMREAATHSLELRQFAIKRARLTSRFEAAEQPFLVIGNRGDLQQAMLNVIINAEQALAGKTGTIVIRLINEPGEVVFQVDDEGTGFTIQPADQAFEPFVSSRDPYESAGLGLWAARVLVEEHGGRVTVETSEKGSSVAIRLPAAPGGTRPTLVGG